MAGGIRRPFAVKCMESPRPILPHLLGFGHIPAMIDPDSKNICIQPVSPS